MDNVDFRNYSRAHSISVYTFRSITKQEPQRADTRSAVQPDRANIRHTGQSNWRVLQHSSERPIFDHKIAGGDDQRRADQHGYTAIESDAVGWRRQRNDQFIVLISKKYCMAWIAVQQCCRADLLPSAHFVVNERSQFYADASNIIPFCLYQLCFDINSEYKRSGSKKHTHQHK